MSIQSNMPVCAIVGVGPGNGAAFARRFTSEGYRVALLARSLIITKGLAEELDGARAYVVQDFGKLFLEFQVQICSKV